jgi:thiamine transport system substrate-binding protein
MARAPALHAIQAVSCISWPQQMDGIGLLAIHRLLAVILALAAPLAALAEDKPALTVFTYDGFAAEWGAGPPLKAAFEATCACTVNFVATDSSIGALRRVQLEGATTSADIVLGLDTATAGEARATGLFAPHGLALPQLALPEPWTDADFVPFDYGYFAFVYDRDKLPIPPASFEDLTALPPSVKIVIEDPRSDTPGLGLVLWIKALYGDRAPEIWAGLKPHVLTVARDWSEAYALFLAGEADLVLSYTTSPAYHSIADKDDSYAFADFAAGHFPQVEVAGVLKTSRHPDLARQFLGFLVSPEAQRIIPTTNWMYPVRDLGTDLPAAFSAQPQPKALTPMDAPTITADKGAWIEEALAALR